MATAATPPSALSHHPFASSRIMRRLLHPTSTSTMSGGANTPFTTADQKSSRSASTRAKVSAVPSTMLRAMMP